MPKLGGVLAQPFRILRYSGSNCLFDGEPGYPRGRPNTKAPMERMPINCTTKFPPAAMHTAIVPPDTSEQMHRHCAYHVVNLHDF